MTRVQEYETRRVGGLTEHRVYPRKNQLQQAQNNQKQEQEEHNRDPAPARTTPAFSEEASSSCRSTRSSSNVGIFRLAVAVLVLVLAFLFHLGPERARGRVQQTVSDTINHVRRADGETLRRWSEQMREGAESTWLSAREGAESTWQHAPEWVDEHARRGVEVVRDSSADIKVPEFDWEWNWDWEAGRAYFVDQTWVSTRSGLGARLQSLASTLVAACSVAFEHLGALGSWTLHWLRWRPHWLPCLTGTVRDAISSYLSELEMPHLDTSQVVALAFSLLFSLALAAFILVRSDIDYRESTGNRRADTDTQNRSPRSPASGSSSRRSVPSALPATRYARPRPKGSCRSPRSGA